MCNLTGRRASQGVYLAPHSCLHLSFPSKGALFHVPSKATWRIAWGPWCPSSPILPSDHPRPDIQCSDPERWLPPHCTPGTWDPPPSVCTCSWSFQGCLPASGSWSWRPSFHWQLKDSWTCVKSSSLMFVNFFLFCISFFINSKWLWNMASLTFQDIGL